MSGEQADRLDHGEHREDREQAGRDHADQPIGSLSASFLPRNTASPDTTSSAAQAPMNTETGSS